MIEPLFGPASPPWPGMPATAPVWPGGQPIVTAGAAFGVPQGPPATIVGPVTGALPPQMIAVPPTNNSFDLGRFRAAGLFPAGLAPEITAGYGVPALLAAVAIRRGQPLGPTNDQEIEDFVYDALELLPGTSDVEARVEGARVTLSGLVQQKRLKRDIGEIVWGIPIVADVQNNVTITTRRRSRAAAREGEQPGTSQGRKQS